jgi:hypothetical protein
LVNEVFFSICPSKLALSSGVTRYFLLGLKPTTAITLRYLKIQEEKSSFISFFINDIFADFLFYSLDRLTAWTGTLAFPYAPNGKGCN